MRIDYTSDTNSEAKIHDLTYWLDNKKFRSAFQKRDYGSDFAEIIIVFNARDPELNFRQRITYSKAERKLYMDIMLSLPEMVNTDKEGRIRLGLKCISSEIPRVISKYKRKDFDADRFFKDLHDWLVNTGYFEKG